ncbi:Sulfhydryl oxidase 1 [Sesamum angolense]|uniref:Sulfhydryl oxidase n=1 Tax=Sesamum angolense TaxID=2727404 RepID=A0AAE1XE01_9LAMI|nr:Sulfhydryl oxidase 1 [Sesamum angolense]
MLTSFFPSNEASSSSWISVAAPFAVGSRSLLRSVADAAADKPDYAVELNATNFDSVFKETSAAYAIVEFFAHCKISCFSAEEFLRGTGCPACRNYKPQYEKIARIFNGADAVHPGIIIVTRVDCAFKLLDCFSDVLFLAAQINTNLCDKFSVGHYPMLLWGPPSKFVSGSWDPKQEKSEIRSIDDGRTAELLLNWINKQLSSSYRLDDEKYENDQLQKNASDFGQIAHAIYDIEEATFNAFEIILDHKMIKSDTRASLVKFFQLLAVHHPSRSCGLWLLLHAVSVRVDDGESQMAFTTICDFVHNFFICEECRLHFYSMCSSVSSPFKKARDFVLWLWEAHNKVNKRLMKEEPSLGTADPEFPKVMWPPRQLCPSCYLTGSGKNDGYSRIDWDQDEGLQADGVVAENLLASTHAVVVSVGAALGIAVASCAFGALACYWRQRQKSRKAMSDILLFLNLSLQQLWFKQLSQFEDPRCNRMPYQVDSSV